MNHDDLVFFRASPEAGVPPLTLDESRAFATWIALGGGIVKLGDKLVDMAAHPDWIDTVRRLLPAWSPGTRPVDVLTRDYPEQYRGTVAAPAGDWELVGLINWGKNRDWTTNPPTAMPDTKRTYTIQCASTCLVYEFWSESLLTPVSDHYAVEVAPHTAQVFSLRPAVPGAIPQLLGTNRHVTMGATDMGAVAWTDATRTLAGTLTGAVGTDAAPWEYHLAFHAAGRAVDHAEVDGVASPSATQDGDLVRVRFALPASAQGHAVAWRVIFR